MTKPPTLQDFGDALLKLQAARAALAHSAPPDSFEPCAFCSVGYVCRLCRARAEVELAFAELQHRWIGLALLEREREREQRAERHG